MKELILEANLKNLDTVIDFVSVELESNNFPAIIRDQIAIAAEEVFVNIANYAYTPETGTVRLCIEISTGELRMTFQDSGKPYNPLDKLEPDFTLPVKDRPIGGLGIFMVKKLWIRYNTDMKTV